MYKNQTPVNEMMKQLQFPQVAECEHRDRNMAQILDMVDAGIAGIQVRHPDFVKPKLKFGLRGIRYYVEFPILAKHIDAFSYILGTEKIIQEGKT